MKAKLRKDAMERGICRESFAGFQKRVVETLYSVGNNLVDKVILSMEKRISLIIQGDGERLSY